MYLETVAWLTVMPSLSSSPWILGEPQKGFDRDMRKIRSRISLGILRLPGQLGLLFHLQYSLNPFLCQRMTVSGWTIIKEVRQPVQNRERIHLSIPLIAFE